MSVFRDPPRLGDDPSQGWLQQALDAGRAELPDQAQLEGLWERIVSAPPGGGTDGGAPDGGGSDGGGSAPSGPAEPPAIDPSSAASAGGGLLGGSAAKLAATLALGMVTLGGALTIRDGGPTRDAQLGLSSGWSQPEAGGPARSLSVTPPEPAATAPPHGAPAAAPRQTPQLDTASPLAAPPAVEVESEIAILMKARAALASAPAEALKLVAHAAQQHPRGSLGQEREVIRVQALVQLGRRAAALALARALVRRHPDSAYARRLATLLPEL